MVHNRNVLKGFLERLKEFICNGVTFYDAGAGEEGGYGGMQ